MNNASWGHCLFEAHSNQGLLVAKQLYTTLRQDNQQKIAKAKTCHLWYPFSS